MTYTIKFLVRRFIVHLAQQGNDYDRGGYVMSKNAFNLA